MEKKKTLARKYKFGRQGEKIKLVRKYKKLAARRENNVSKKA